MCKGKCLPHPKSPTPPTATWEAPPLGWIKLNVDAALSESSFALAVVARNSSGSVIKVWTKLHIRCPPLVAEASAILWAVQLAHQENWNHIIIEGDAKNGIDPLALENAIPDWSIVNIISSILNFKTSFLGCLFRWVKKNSDVAAHAAAKLSLRAKKPLCL